MAYKQWQLARADKARIDEAVSRLCAEFRFSRDGYAWFAELWLVSATRVGKCRGKRAYAYERHQMWLKKQADMIASYEDARRSGVPSEQLDHARVSLVSNPTPSARVKLNAFAVHPAIPRAALRRHG